MIAQYLRERLIKYCDVLNALLFIKISSLLVFHVIVHKHVSNHFCYISIITFHYISLNVFKCFLWINIWEIIASIIISKIHFWRNFASAVENRCPPSLIMIRFLLLVGGCRIRILVRAWMFTVIRNSSKALDNGLFNHCAQKTDHSATYLSNEINWLFSNYLNE